MKTKSGLVTIDHIKEQDEVFSYNEKQNTSSWKRVTHLFKKTASKLNRLIVEKDTFLVTPEHRFFTKSGWLQAAALSAGMLLQTTSGFAELHTNETIDTSAIVYNFTVQENHTYYVGKQQVLTHNDCEKLAALIKQLGDQGVDFVNDFKNNKALLDKFVSGEYDIDAWKRLDNVNPNSFIKKNPDRLAIFGKFSPENQILLAKYTDVNASSSLAKFLDDCDDEFIKLIEGDSKYLEYFLSHKNSTTWIQDQFEVFNEAVKSDGFSTSMEAKLLKWSDHSADATQFGIVSQKGTDLSNLIFADINARKGNLFSELASKIGIDVAELAKYEIYREVPLITEGGFMKADILLVKRTPDGIEDVILIENKLSEGTDYTVRQKEGWKKVAKIQDMTLKYKVDGVGFEGKPSSLNVGEFLMIKKEKVFKISDHGEADLMNAKLQNIDVDAYLNYIYRGKK